MRLIFLISLFWLGSASVLAQSPVPTAPSINATSYVLVDHHSDTIIAELDAAARVEPASITKLMTSYVVFSEIAAGSLTLDDEVLISEKAWRTEGSRMFVEVGKRVSVEELLKGVIIQSGNDASVALAEHVAGAEEVFAGMMNEQARALGMVNTHYVNATGLPFNLLTPMERRPDGRTNPMVNPGAIAVAGLVPGGSVDERWALLSDRLSAFAGRPLALDDEVYESARTANFRNRGIAWLLESYGGLGASPADTIELYTRQSCVAVTAEDLAVMGATLADGGVNPRTGE